MAAERTPVRQQYPVDSLFDRVSNTHASKFDRFAKRTVCGRHNLTLARFHQGA
jgi:hypothetical protein